MFGFHSLCKSRFRLVGTAWKIDGGILSTFWRGLSPASRLRRLKLASMFLPRRSGAISLGRSSRPIGSAISTKHGFRSLLPRAAFRNCVSTRCLCTSYWLRSEEHTSELQLRSDLVCRLLLEKKNDERLLTIIIKFSLHARHNVS